MKAKDEIIWHKIHAFVDEWTANQVEFFQKDNPILWEENFNDADKTIAKSLLGEKEFIELMHQYINSVKNQF